MIKSFPWVLRPARCLFATKRLLSFNFSEPYYLDRNLLWKFPVERLFELARLLKNSHRLDYSRINYIFYKRVGEYGWREQVLHSGPLFIRLRTVTRYNTRWCPSAYIYTKDHNCPLLATTVTLTLFTNPPTFLQWGRCLRRVGIPGNKRPSWF